MPLNSPPDHIPGFEHRATPADRNSHGRQPDLQRHRLLAREGRRALWLERFDRVKALRHEGRSLTAIAKETSCRSQLISRLALYIFNGMGGREAVKSRLICRIRN
jgi:hypothetical protein